MVCQSSRLHPAKKKKKKRSGHSPAYNFPITTQLFSSLISPPPTVPITPLSTQILWPLNCVLFSSLPQSVCTCCSLKLQYSFPWHFNQVSAQCRPLRKASHLHFSSGFFTVFTTTWNSKYVCLFIMYLSQWNINTAGTRTQFTTVFQTLKQFPTKWAG